MARIRLYTAQSLNCGQTLELESEASHHLCKVLRARTDDEITLFNGDGCDYTAIITKTGKKAQLAVTSKNPNCTESPLDLNLIQGLCRADRMDYAIQKSVELGVRSITVVLTQKSQARLTLNRIEKKIRHWNNIIQSACEQSGRSQIPNLSLADDLQNLISHGLQEYSDNHRFILQPGAANNATSINPGVGPCCVLIGPESGFTDAELSMAQQQGFSGVSLGPRILRAETAGPAIIGILQALHGDLN